MSLERIEITPFAVIAGDILQNRRTGHLTIHHAPLHKVLYWSQGELVLITSANPDDSLGDFLVRRRVLTPERAVQMLSDDPTDIVARFHEAGLLELSQRQSLLREWLAGQFLPLFTLDEGTSIFTDDEAIDPEKRVFLQSTAALVLEGIRSITNGLLLRRSLGDLKREIAFNPQSRYGMDNIPLNDAERRVADALQSPQTIEAFLKHFPSESVVAAKVVIALLAIGLFAVVDHTQQTGHAQLESFDDMQRDLELLAAIGSSDSRSLRALSLSRQLPSLDHYQLLDVPRAATRAQILSQSELIKQKFNPATYPPVIKDALAAIEKRIDEAVSVLKDATRRASYDKLLHERGRHAGGGGEALQQRITQRSIAEQNFAKARDLTVHGDYYGAIVLLKQAVQYMPDNADAWYLLGACQERNPKWRRDAAESFQQALSADPNHVDAMISLGDLYKAQGLTSRAQSCYEDVVRIAPDNQQAKSRLALLKKK